MGIIDSVAILSITPVVDILIHPTLQDVSHITRRILDMMAGINIPISIGSLLLVFIIFNIVRSLLMIISNFFIVKTKYALLRNIILGTFEDFFKARWYFFSSGKQGTLLNTFIHEINVIGEAFGAIAIIFAQIVQCLIFIIVPFYISWKVSLLGISFALLFVLPFTLVEKVSYVLGKKNTSTANEIGSVIQESLSSAKIILGFGNKHKSLSSLSRGFNAHYDATIKSQILGVAITELYYPLGIIVLAAVVISGLRFAVPVSEIVVILYSFSRIVPLIGNITFKKNALNNFFPSYEQVLHLRQSALALEQKTGTMAFPGLNEKISLGGVSFSYPGYAPALQDIKVEIPKGKMIAFVGHSGSGKSTLIDMIMGFNEPLSGKITIDDIPLQEFDINSYRQRIGYVPQDSILFNMSIRDNLLWAKDSATEDEIKAACKKANAADFIEGFPQGYDTVVGDRGVRLSGGQIQRIALARAILRKPDLLILDEATSSVDTQSERLIQQAVEDISKNTTVIVIAHRLSTIINADYIYTLDNGKIVEGGTYSELLQKNGLFSQMVNVQMIGDDKINNHNMSGAK
jgi:ATP-binding cassette subfamily B protein